MSHIIHRLSFGEDFPNIVNPLDGNSKDEGTMKRRNLGHGRAGSYNSVDGKARDWSADGEAGFGRGQGARGPGFDGHEPFLGFFQSVRDRAHQPAGPVSRVRSRTTQLARCKCSSTLSRSSPPTLST